MNKPNIVDELINNFEDNPCDVDKCAKWINDCGLKKVCLQFPDSLAANATEIALQLSKQTWSEVYILGDTTCGSCCIDEVAAQHIDADGIIHFGHACLSRTIRLPIFHIFPKKRIDLADFPRQFKQAFPDCLSKILLFYDVTYAHAVENVYTNLKPMFRNLIMSTLNCASNVEFVDTKHEFSRNIYGRNYVLPAGHRIEDYDAIFLGENGKTLATMALTIPAKKWYFYECTDIQEFQPLNTVWLKRRRFLIEKLKDAKIVGIVIATLAIEDYLQAVVSIKKILKIMNKKSYILHVGKLSPTKLHNFAEIDAFVVITCPESNIFDSRDFFKPILLPYEVELAFNCLREFSSNYCLDFRQLLPGGTNHRNFDPLTECDVSLLSGAIRNNGNNISNIEGMSALTLNSSGSVVIGNAGAQALQQRSWKGVKQTLGQDPIRLTEEGRSGLANHYKNECMHKKT